MNTRGCALVTGASRGIGRAIALELAARGWPIALNYASRREAAEETAESVRACGVEALLVPGDVSDAEAVQSVVRAALDCFGSIGVLVNNAGIARDGLLMRQSEEDIRRVLDVNLTGALLCTRAVAPAMLKKRWGRILQLSSVVGLMGNAGQVAYAAAKAGLVGLTKSCAREFASRNVTVNAIAPGFIETEMTAGLQGWLDRVPLSRAGQPEEVAKLAAFLVSEDAAYITGQVICIDGGLSM